jgi:hypothetical protein
MILLDEQGRLKYMIVVLRAPASAIVKTGTPEGMKDVKEMRECVSN